MKDQEKLTPAQQLETLVVITAQMEPQDMLGVYADLRQMGMKPKLLDAFADMVDRQRLELDEGARRAVREVLASIDWEE